MTPSIDVVDDYAALSRTGADVIVEILGPRPTARVVAATGETPIGVYQELARKAADGTFDGSGLTVLILDEYVGAPADDGGSLASWLRRDFVEPLRIPDAQVIELPADGAPDACAAYDRRMIEDGGLDLAILGIGTNGHIGFNEPPSDAATPTRLVALSEESIAASRRYRDGQGTVPRYAVTLGMAPLLAARACVLLASGPAKAEIVRRAMLGPVSPEVPASFLRERAGVRVIVDRAAWPGEPRP
jgi:glucosamine-6-phosphate deaminase